MFAAARAELAQFHTARVIPAVLLSRVIASLTLCAGQGNHRADIFFGGHVFLFYTTFEKVVHLLTSLV
jgi:hypothetical protein